MAVKLGHGSSRSCGSVLRASGTRKARLPVFDGDPMLWNILALAYKGRMDNRPIYDFNRRSASIDPSKMRPEFNSSIGRC
jgi:hypothetical protein